MRRHRLPDPLGSGTRADPFRVDMSALRRLSIPEPTPQQTIHIRSGKSEDSPTLCGAERTSRDWLRWDHLPGTPYSRGGLFSLLCETCFDLYQAAKKKG